MATNIKDNASRDALIYFPLDQGEKAWQLSVDQLLPRALYEQLARLLQDSRPRSQSTNESAEEHFQKTRGHRAVFIDGARGSGKTTVIVNLPEFLKAQTNADLSELSNEIHVVKPIDPSQLEDTDSLFLNVVVAAVLNDEAIKTAQGRRPAERQAFQESIRLLGNALEGRESQQANIGLDRLRSFMGTQALAFAVHEFFRAALHVEWLRPLLLRWGHQSSSNSPPAYG